MFFCRHRVFDSRTLSVVRSFIKKQYIQMSCDVTSDGAWCLTCSNGFGGNGCEATVSTRAGCPLYNAVFQ